MRRISVAAARNARLMHGGRDCAPLGAMTSGRSEWLRTRGAWLSRRRWMWLPGAAALLLAACSGGGTNHNGSHNAAAPVRSTASAPLLGGGAATPNSGATGTPTSGLQARLDAALLQPSDLPPGYVAKRLNTFGSAIAGETATAATVFTVPVGSAGSAGIEQVFVALIGFKDSGSARSALDESQQAVEQVTKLPGSTIAVSPLSVGPTIGDGATTYTIGGKLAGLDVSGYAVYWLRGPVLAGITQFTTGPALTLDETVALARKQDAKLNAVQ